MRAGGSEVAARALALARSERLAGVAAAGLAAACLLAWVVPQQDAAADAETRYRTFARAQAARVVALREALDPAPPPDADVLLEAALRKRFGEPVAGEVHEAREAAAIDRFAADHEPPLRAAFGASEALGLGRVFGGAPFAALAGLLAISAVARPTRPRALLAAGLLAGLAGEVVHARWGREGTLVLGPGERVDAWVDAGGGRRPLGTTLELVSARAGRPRRLVADWRDVPAGLALDLITHAVPLRPGASMTLSPGPAQLDVTVEALGPARATPTRVTGGGPAAARVRWSRAGAGEGEAWLVEGAALRWDEAGPAVSLARGGGGLVARVFVGDAVAVAAPLEPGAAIEHAGLTLSPIELLPAGSDPRHVATPSPGGQPAAHVRVVAPEGARDVWLLVDDPKSIVTMGNVRLSAATDRAAPPVVTATLASPGGDLEVGDDAPVRVGGLDLRVLGADARGVALAVADPAGWRLPGPVHLLFAAGLAALAVGSFRRPAR